MKYRSKPRDQYPAAMNAAFDSMLNEKSKDQRTWSERKWQQGKLAPIAQKPCDHGLFSDDAKQQDLSPDQRDKVLEFAQQFYFEG